MTETCQPSSKTWLKPTQWLAGQHRQTGRVVVDGSVLSAGAQARRQGRVSCRPTFPARSFFDINAIADHSSDLPHMLPGPKQFAEAVGALGIADDRHHRGL